MKFIIGLLLAALSVALATGLTEQQRTMLRLTVDQCIQEEGITKAQSLALRNDNSKDVDDKVKCFANCVMEKLGLTVDGQINRDAVLQLLTPIAGADKVNALITSCEALKGADKCDTGFKMQQCITMNRLPIV